MMREVVRGKDYMAEETRRGWKRRGQMEIAGLVIIVILITLGMLFMAQFALKDAPDKKIFTRKGLAYSTVSAVLKTSVAEPSCFAAAPDAALPTVGGELLEDCATHYPPGPFSDFRYDCRGKNSCDFLQEFIPELLDQSVGSWGKGYEFHATLIKAERSSDELLSGISSRGGCSGKDKDTSGLFPINTGAGLVEVSLFICD